MLAHSPTPFWPDTGREDFEAFLIWAEQLAACYVNGVKAVTAPQAGSPATLCA